MRHAFFNGRIWLVTAGLFALTGACSDESDAPNEGEPARDGSSSDGAGPRHDATPDADLEVPSDAATPPDSETPDASPPAPDAMPDAAAPIDDFEALIRLGKQHLADARAHDALRAFEQALASRPDHPSALFGAAIAGAIDAVELSSMILSLTGQLGNFLITRNEYLAELIHHELMGLRAEFLLALDRAERLEADEVDFEVEAAWVYFGLEPMLVYRGVFDGGDLHLLRATVSFVLALDDLVAAQDLRTDLLGVVSTLRGGFGGIDFPAIGNIVALLLYIEGEDFLSLHPVDGAPLFETGRAHLAAVGRELNLAVDWMSAHAGEDSRAQVSALTLGGDGAPSALFVHSLVQQDADGERVETPLIVELNAELLGVFAQVSASFDQPGARVEFKTHVLPILTTVIYAAAQLGLLDSLLGGLPFDLTGLGQGPLEALLSALLPLPVALDLGTFYSHPVGMRPLFPLPDPERPDQLWAEWECPEDLDAEGYPSGPARLLCSDEAALIDGPRFVGSDDALEPDGITSRSPYLLWEDPTFNGLLWVDLSDRDVPGWEAPGYRLADNHSLNAALVSSLGPILELLGGLLGSP